MTEKIIFWDTCLESIESKVCHSDFLRWVKPLVFLKEDNHCSVIAPDAYFVDLIKYNGIWDIVQQEFKTIFEQKLHIKYVNSNSQTNLSIEREALPHLEQRRSTTTSQLSSVVADRSKQMLTQKISNDRSQSKIKSLRADYTFDVFITLSSNQLAYTIAQAISKGEHQYNPLLIYSNPGLGKTHLLNAIANAIEEINPMRRSIYLQAVDFVKDVVAAIRNKQIDRLKASYQSYDVLLIDDVQFFSGKQSTMEEFFQLMNFFLNQDRQVVLSSDELPKISVFPERIRSRLTSGLPVEINMPTFEDRVLLITQFANEKKITLDSDIVYWIATQALISVRNLKALLNPLQANLCAGLVERMTLNEVQRILAPMLISTHAVSPERIVEETARFYSLRPVDLCGKLRRKKIAHARHIAISLIKELTDLSVVQIGEEFNRDHSTVIHALKKVLELRQSNELVNQDFLRLSSRICHPRKDQANS